MTLLLRCPPNFMLTPVEANPPNLIPTNISGYMVYLKPAWKERTSARYVASMVCFTGFMRNLTQSVPDYAPTCCEKITTCHFSVALTLYWATLRDSLLAESFIAYWLKVHCSSALNLLSNSPKFERYSLVTHAKLQEKSFNFLLIIFSTREATKKYDPRAYIDFVTDLWFICT